MGNYANMELRNRLDKALASPNLFDERCLRGLVSSQISRSTSSVVSEDGNEALIEKCTSKLNVFLETLRSVSGNVHDTKLLGHKDWKVKKENDVFRVMYREGPQGSPFHTLLVEGQVDGPIDACLCVSWEAGLYDKWWPQSSVPPFKIMSCYSLQKIGIGDEISLVRVKVPWPISSREALLHFIEFEFIEEDLVFVLVNTLSDTEDITFKPSKLAADRIPESEDVVRIDLVGGFVLQKVNPNKSYFRTIMTMDIKVDFVPPAFINFISRQLIGRGFELYQKVVASTVNGDEDFESVLQREPLYFRIREAFRNSKRDINEGNDSHDDLLQKARNGHVTGGTTTNCKVIAKNQPCLAEKIAPEVYKSVPNGTKQHICAPIVSTCRECELKKGEYSPGNMLEKLEVFDQTVHFQKDNQEWMSACSSTSSISSADCYFDAGDGMEMNDMNLSHDSDEGSARYSITSCSNNQDFYFDAREWMESDNEGDFPCNADGNSALVSTRPLGNKFSQNKGVGISISHPPVPGASFIQGTQRSSVEEPIHRGETDLSSLSKEWDVFPVEVDALQRCTSKKLKKHRRLRLCCLCG